MTTNAKKTPKTVQEVLAERAPKLAKNQVIVDVLSTQLNAVETELAALDKKRVDELVADRVKLKRTLESYGWTDEAKVQAEYDAYLKAEEEKAAKAAEEAASEPTDAE